MPCEVEYTNEFEAWWVTLTEAEQDSVHDVIDILEVKGLTLGSPYSSEIKSSRFGHMRELRIQHAGRPYRVFYAFDPTRSAILLIGGEKSDGNRFYKRMVPIADRIYEEYLKEISNGKEVL